LYVTKGLSRLSPNLSSPSVSVGGPLIFVNKQNVVTPRERLPASMHSKLQWPVGRQAGMTVLSCFGTASYVLTLSNCLIERYPSARQARCQLLVMFNSKPFVKLRVTCKS